MPMPSLKKWKRWSGNSLTQILFPSRTQFLVNASLSPFFFIYSFLSLSLPLYLNSFVNPAGPAIILLKRSSKRLWFNCCVKRYFIFSVVDYNVVYLSKWKKATSTFGYSDPSLKLHGNASYYYYDYSYLFLSDICIFLIWLFT